MQEGAPDPATIAIFGLNMSNGPSWLNIQGTVLHIVLHVLPGAVRSEVVGTHRDALKVRLAAPPVDGRANEELIRFLAEQFGVPKRQVEILRGTTGRRKHVRITSPACRPDTGW